RLQGDWSSDVCSSDLAESCDGLTDDCPPDLFAPAGTFCRLANGACEDVADCNGADPTCPPNTPLPAGTTCRAAAGDCDVAESCEDRKGVVEGKRGGGE